MKKFFCYGKKDFCENTELCIECPHFVGAGGEYREAPMTNADRIRAMSDEDLARFLASVENRRSAAGGGAQWFGMAHALKWLQQPSEDSFNG